MEIPVPALIAAGFRITADPACVVRADVSVDEDGLRTGDSDSGFGIRA